MTPASDRKAPTSVHVISGLILGGMLYAMFRATSDREFCILRKKSWWGRNFQVCIPLYYVTLLWFTMFLTVLYIVAIRWTSRLPRHGDQCEIAEIRAEAMRVLRLSSLEVIVVESMSIEYILDRVIGKYRELEVSETQLRNRNNELKLSREALVAQNHRVANMLVKLRAKWTNLTASRRRLLAKQARQNVPAPIDEKASDVDLQQRNETLAALVSHLRKENDQLITSQRDSRKQISKLNDTLESVRADSFEQKALIRQLKQRDSGLGQEVDRKEYETGLDSSKIVVLEAEIKELREDQEKARRENQRLQATCDDLEAQVAKAHADVSTGLELYVTELLDTEVKQKKAWRERLAIVVHLLNEIKINKEEVDKLYEAARKDTHAQSTMIKELEAAKMALEEKEQVLEGRYEEARHRIELLISEGAAASEASEVALHKLSARLDKSEDTKQRLIRAVKSRDEQLTQYRAAEQPVVEKLQHQMERQERRCNQLKAEVDNLTYQLSLAEEAATALRVDNEQKTAQVEEVQGQLKEAGQRINEVEYELKGVRAERALSRAEVSELSARLEGMSKGPVFMRRNR